MTVKPELIADTALIFTAGLEPMGSSVATFPIRVHNGAPGG